MQLRVLAVAATTNPAVLVPFVNDWASCTHSISLQFIPQPEYSCAVSVKIVQQIKNPESFWLLRAW
jgi:hypothetical protein